MIVRLLLALLLAAFATPAPAAMTPCHRATAVHHGMPAAPEKTMVAHVCVGCIPLADWLGERIAARIGPLGTDPVARVARLDLGSVIAPALPPPRRG